MAHSSHKTRLSPGSSVYDEMCENCGITDKRGDERLNDPCPQAPKETSQEKEKNDSAESYRGE